MNAIPYTVERRPDTGVNNVQLGVWLFLASEVMLFGGLFSAYFMLRAGAPAAWAPLRDHLATAVMATLALVASGAMLVFARKVTTAGRPARFGFFASILFAVSFCLVKVGEWESLIRHGLTPASSTQMATYFLLTGVHVLHVAGGALAVVWLAVTSSGVSSAGRSAAIVNRIDAVLLYWYFVDIVWLTIVVLLYVA